MAARQHWDTGVPSEGRDLVAPRANCKPPNDGDVAPSDAIHRERPTWNGRPRNSIWVHVIFHQPKTTTFWVMFMSYSYSQHEISNEVAMTQMYPGSLSVPPLGNRALIRHSWGTMAVNNPLLRPAFLAGVTWWKVSQLCLNICFPSLVPETYRWKNLRMESLTMWRLISAGSCDKCR